MNQRDLQKLYENLQARFHYALSSENNDEYTKIIVNEIAKEIAIAPQLEAFRNFYKQQDLNKIAAFKEQRINTLKKMELLIDPLLSKESEFPALKNINAQHKVIIETKGQLDWKIKVLTILLEIYINNLLKDMRFNLNHDYTKLLQPLIKVDSVHGPTFLFHQDLIAYEQEQDEIEKFITRSLYADICNIINLYQVKGIASFTGKNSQSLNLVDCNRTIRRVLDAIKQWIPSADNSSISYQNISYDASTGYLNIIHNMITHRIKFGKQSLRGKILETLFPAGKPRKEPINFADMYNEIKQQEDHKIWDEFDCVYFDDLGIDNNHIGENRTNADQEKIKKSIRDSIDGKNAINDKIFNKTGFEKVIFIDNLNIFIRYH